MSDMQIAEIGTALHLIGWWILHSLWQGVAIGFALAAFLKILRWTTPQTRYVFACIALSGMIVLPAITAVVFDTPQVTSLVSVMDELDSDADADSALRLGRDDRGEGTSGYQAISSKNSPATTWNTSAMSDRLLSLLSLMWLVGVVFYATELGRGIFSINRLRRDTSHVPAAVLDDLLNELIGRLGVKRKIEICESPLINIPMTMGWIYPIILVPPSSLLGLAPHQLQTIIAHELIHIKRYDYVVNFLQSVAETLLFFHPAAAWASRKIREEREFVCDDLTVAVCADPAGYARALTKLARLQRQAEQLALASTDGELKGRIYRIVSDRKDKAVDKKFVLSGFFSLIAVSLVLAVSLAGLKVLSHNVDSGLRERLVDQSPKGDEHIVEDHNRSGESTDDLSREDPRYREAALRALGPHRGSVIVMNPHTGRVYSIVNQDWAFRRQWTAGSTFKMITSLAGIEENKLKESNKGFGYNPAVQMNLARSLAVSDNDYFDILGREVGSDTLFRYSKQFGFGEVTGINHPGEIGAYVPAVVDQGGGPRTGVMGGDIRVTPLQLAVFLSALFNGGKILVPQSTYGEEPITIQDRGSLSISESSIAELRKALRAAVETGTGKKAQQGIYEVSGKTGTIANNDANVGLFASHGLSKNSELVIVVVLEGKKENGAVAAQIAGNIYGSV